MLKKIILVVLVLAFLLLFVSYMRASQGANSPQPDPAETAAQSNAETVAPSEAPAATPTPVPTPVVTLSPEEYDALIAGEIEEMQEESSVLEQEGTDAPTINVTDGEVLEITETQAVGGM